MIDTNALYGALAGFPTGVAALVARVDGEPEGMVASSFSVGASFDPPLVMLAVRNASTTWPLLRGSERIGVSILAAEHRDACRRLASRTRETRFDGLDLTDGAGGAIAIGGAALHLECSVHAEIPAGDHHVVLLRVEDFGHAPVVEPLVYHRTRLRELRDVA